MTKLEVIFKIIIDDKNSVITQKYSDKYFILITTFSNNENEFEIIDFMPRYQKEWIFYSPPEIIRIFKHMKGEPRFKIVYDPRLEYSNGITNSYIKERFIVSVIDHENHDTLYLYTSFNKKKFLNGT